MSRNGHSGAPGSRTVPKIRLSGVSVSFGSRQSRIEALRAVDLEVRAGEFVCVVGPSGCGKSTLLNLIAGLVPPESGAVFKDEQRITGPGPDRAVIFQEAALFPWLTAVQNVEFALRHIRNRRERRARAMEQLQMVHLSRFADAYPHELSGGMRQRVSIARALALDPDVLLMDEPFAALDAQTRDLLIEEVKRIWLATRNTVQFVTNNVMEAVALVDRVICMGTRPGCVKQELRIALPRPRVPEHPDTARVAARIMANLRDEIAKIVREESDLDAVQAGGRGSDPDLLLHPDAGVMGDGI
ncbi:MAG: ABC transporter ATP-binding protein [Chloroherpetonaceae bacterium]|nr:ABC transporter ATP-binding protein [Chloroherpetonaceae bacterium]